MFDRDRIEFVGGEPLFLRCSLWRPAGENAAQPLTRGMRITVTGKLRQRTFDDKEGRRRATMEIDAEDVAVSLAYACAAVTKTYRAGTLAQGGSAPDRAQSPPAPAPAEPHPF
ncbi:single-stranded DNA-binding protein [Streptomyces sp. IMTB 2501]|uniref:single-stranded DNA-binding protein n=1 Tax=Streptomyces sp. IMTB 2501 TaxID=1776340 RepID=UPI0009A234B8|nr:single-stranded DNA-binding protein [Streptomyces sp. IMTB 2501]